MYHRRPFTEAWQAALYMATNPERHPGWRARIDTEKLARIHLEEHIAHFETMTTDTGAYRKKYGAPLIKVARERS